MIKPSFGELFIDHAQEDRNAIHLYVAQPSPLEEKNLGRVFSVLEFDEPPAFAAAVAARLVETFSQAYYHSADFEAEAAFERALHKVNTTVQDLIAEHGENWPYKLNAVVGVIHSTTLYLSYVGAVEAQLAHGEAMIDILQRQQGTEIKPLKLFTNIITGQCPEHSAVIVTTANLLDYLSLEKIRRIIKDHPPDEAVNYLTSVLGEQDTLTNIAALIFTLEQSSKAVSAESTNQDTLERSEFSDRQDSMAKLIKQERATGDLLAPSIWPTIKKRFQRVSAGAGKRDAAVNRSLRAGRLVSDFLVQAVMGLSYLVKQGLKLIRQRRSVSSSLGKIKRLTLAQKLFLGIFALAIITFLISVLVKNRSVEEEQNLSQYQQAITDVTNLLGEIESKQIMKDEAGARTLIGQADTLLGSIPTDLPIYQEQGVALRTTIDQLNQELNKVTVLPTLTAVADWTTVDQAAAVGHITAIGSNIFGFSQATGAVYRVNLETAAVSAVIATSESQAAYRSVENDSAATSLALTAADSFVQFNPVLEKTSTVQVATTTANDQIIDLDIFSSRLYTLTGKQIFRAQKSGDAYSKPQAWLNAEYDFSSAQAFDIDGSIYVLLTSGEIIKFDSGAKSDFSIDEFTPSLAGATQLIKAEPSSAFYILNPSTQRIVILNSDGTLDKQLVAPELAEATDLLVDTTTSVIYVTTGQKVYSITLS